MPRVSTVLEGEIDMPPVGFKHSDETRKKYSESRKGKPKSEDHKRKISESHIGINPTEETRKKIGVAKRGIALKPEHILKLALAHTGTKRSEETRRKMSESGKGRVFSEEHKQNLSKALKGNPLKLGVPFSEEHRKKISKSLTGNPLITGENSHAWRGGASFEPYCPKFNRDLKNRIRTYFDNKCVECGSTPTNYKLPVHHVNFDKMSCCSDVVPLFVPLCRSCHSKTNFNRPYWEQHFTDLINTKYNGNCYLTKQEVN